MNDNHLAAGETLASDKMRPLTTQIVTAYLSHNKVSSRDLPDVIRQVHDALHDLDTTARPASSQLKPAVPVKKSVMPDYIICLEDGRKRKLLKRYLLATYNMTPEAYRQRWGLPATYPMIAPNYAKQRRTYAMAIGLGTYDRSEAGATPDASNEQPAEASQHAQMRSAAE